jgi:hypothetical protein
MLPYMKVVELDVSFLKGLELLKSEL